jgi:prolyl oligopeptidase
MDPRPTLAAPDDDPWLWLEEVEGERALAWVAEQNARTLAAFGGPRFEAERDALKAALDRPDRLPVVTRRGAWLWNFWRDDAHPRGLWRRTTMERYRTPDPEWETVLDLDALALEEDEDWVWQGADMLAGTHDRALLSLSRGGGDACVIREFDVQARAFVEGGFHLPEAKGGADWVDRDTLLVSSAYGGATRASYARTVRLWKRGTHPAEAAILFEVDEAHMGGWGGVDPDEPGRLFFGDKLAFYESDVFLGDATGPKTRLDLPRDAGFQWHRGWLAVRPRSAWEVGGTTHPPDSVLVISLDEFLAGSRDFRTVFTPAPRRALQHFLWCGGRLVLAILDELRPVFTLVTPGKWEAHDVPRLPENGVASLWPLDDEPAESDGTLLAQIEDPLTPPTLMLVPPGLAAPEVLRSSSPMFTADGLVVTRHEAVAADGTRIPYFQTGPAGAPTGDAPVHLYAYGGFRIPILPNYRGIMGKLWLERGGTTVIACLRGGGEFGTAWHEAGKRERKRLSHDDLAAVAEDLVRRGVTRPSRIAAEGGSNGGLLIANMLTRHPEKFGALFCTIPLVDMRRFHKLLSGASWIAEYGDPENPQDWDFLGPLSAYHAAEPGRRYPPILLATTRRDDRVHPGHARKMAAKLQAMGCEAWFHEPAAGGHGYGKDNADVASFAALGAAFLRRAIGWDA